MPGLLLIATAAAMVAVHGAPDAPGQTGVITGAVDPSTWIGSNIRTFTESVDSLLGERVRSAIGEARTLCFLGFGFLRQNVGLLRPRANRYAGLILSTAYGVSNDDRDAIRSIVHGLGREARADIQVDPGTCREMLDAHRIGLSVR